MQIINNKVRKILFISMVTCICVLCAGCGKKDKNGAGNSNAVSGSNFVIDDLTGSMNLQYAQQFSVDYLEDGYSLVTIAGEDQFLVVPEGKELPKDLGDEISVIQLPVQNIYLAASSSMDMFRRIDGLDVVKMTGTKPEDWSIEEIEEKVSGGQIQYVGKYSMPDYEMILGNACDLVIESTMIYHSPEVKEQFERLGLPVLVEHSSYESTPLGRVEWIKLYGLLAGKEQEADAFMEQCIEKYAAVVSNVKEDESNQQSEARKKVAFFYISSNGNAVVRKPGDYITKMIDIAGGQYAFSELPSENDNAMSTMNMQMEAFYQQAVDADILIYNSTIDGEVTTVSQLLEKSQMLADFKAVKEGNVWCTSNNMYQEVTGTVGVIEDFYAVFSGAEKSLNYLHKLQQ